MLADGGGAADAAIATAIALTVVEPVSNGIGSDAFAIVWDGRELHGLNASGRSPAAWTPEYFGGNGVPTLGWNSVTVPGAVSAWVELHAKFGKLPFERVFEPAISYARNGFLVSPTIAEQWAAMVPLFKSQPGFAEVFMPGGRAPKPGERVTLPDHSATLNLIAETQGEAFYRGELAAKLEAHATAQRRRHAGQRPRRASRRLGRDDQRPLPWLHGPRDTAQWPGHCCLDRPRNTGTVRHGLVSNGFRRPRASADRSVEARFRRRAGLRRRRRPHAGASGAPARRGIPAASGRR